MGLCCGKTNNELTPDGIFPIEQKNDASNITNLVHKKLITEINENISNYFK